MIEQLNNPVWSALTSGNADLSCGNDKAKYFMQGISPFVGVHNNTLENYSALKEIIPHDKPVVIFTIDKDLDASPWKIIDRIEGYQMMFEGTIPEDQNIIEVVNLSEQNIPEMLKLTSVNSPGPFLEKTIKFGGYEGIFEEHQLVAMAGQRFHCGPYIEISAVCTHPTHTGKGYARKLIYRQIGRLLGAGNIPYLHVKANNTRALRIYQNMGFVIRTEMVVYILQK